MTHPLVAFFSKIPLFAQLTTDEMGELIRAIQPVQLNEGDFLFKEGDPADAAFVVQSGELNIYLERPEGRVELSVIGPEAILGEITLIEGGKRSATARAIRACSLFRLDKTEFDFLRRNFRPVAYKLMKEIALTVCARLRDTNQLIQNQWQPKDAETDGPAPTEQDTETLEQTGLLKRLKFWKNS